MLSNINFRSLPCSELASLSHAAASYRRLITFSLKLSPIAISCSLDEKANVLLLRIDIFTQSM